VVKWWKSKDWGNNVFAIRWEKVLETVYSTFFVFITCIFKPYLSCVYCCNIMCICLSNLYLLYFMCICCDMCVLLFLLWMPDCWIAVSIRKVLRTATSTQTFLGFPLSTSECSDGSPSSKLLLHASHVALLI